MIKMRDVLFEMAYIHFDLEGEYAALNKKLFGNKLPDIPLNWVFSRTTGGYVKYDNARNNKVKNLSLALSKVWNRPVEDYKGLLIHEMIHVWDAITNGPQRDLHGETFMKMRDKIITKGYDVPLEDDITNLSIGVEIKPRDFLVGICKDKNKNYATVMNYSKANVRKMPKMFANIWDGSIPRGTEVHMFKSSNPNLLKYTISRKSFGLEKINWELYSDIKKHGEYIQTFYW